MIINFYIPTDEHITTDDNPSYNIHTISGMRALLYF